MMVLGSKFCPSACKIKLELVSIWNQSLWYIIIVHATRFSFFFTIMAVIDSWELDKHAGAGLAVICHWALKWISWTPNRFTRKVEISTMIQAYSLTISCLPICAPDMALCFYSVPNFINLIQERVFFRAFWDIWSVCPVSVLKVWAFYFFPIWKFGATSFY